jgi:hypothetical protein
MVRAGLRKSLLALSSFFFSDVCAANADPTSRMKLKIATISDTLS